jgi:hypothetical protein
MLRKNVEQNNVYDHAMSDIQSSGYNEPTWDVPPSYTAAGVVVEHYNGHDYITEQYNSTGGVGYHRAWWESRTGSPLPFSLARAMPNVIRSGELPSYRGIITTSASTGIRSPTP